MGLGLLLARRILHFVLPFSSFPESSVDVSSRKTRNYILIPFSPYPSSRVGNAAFGSWKILSKKEAK